MKILWFTWKDITNPRAGGAEVVSSELAKRCVADGHQVIFIVGGYDGCEHKELIDGYRVIRVGGQWSVYWRAYAYYKKYLTGWADVIIEEVNTVPFFTPFYTHDTVSPQTVRGASAHRPQRTGWGYRGFIKNQFPTSDDRRPLHFLFFHQLCRRIWFYQMFFPLNVIGYIIEPLYLRFLAFGSGSSTADVPQVLTVSQSTKDDLARYGFHKDRVHIVSEGIALAPIDEVKYRDGKKYDPPTMLCLGAIRAMKRTSHAIRAFVHAKKHIPDLELVLAGDGSGQYAKKVSRMIARSPYRDAIHVMGRVSGKRKSEILRKSHVIVVTSVKEGWGLIVTEANSQGTPAVVYNVDGLRDSVRHGETGIVCERNTPKCLAENVVRLFEDGGMYVRLRREAWKWSKQITFEKSYEDFKKVLKI